MTGEEPQWPEKLDKINSCARQRLSRSYRAGQPLGSWPLAERWAQIMQTPDGTAAATVTIVPRWRR